MKCIGKCSGVMYYHHSSYLNLAKKRQLFLKR